MKKAEVKKCCGSSKKTAGVKDKNHKCRCGSGGCGNVGRKENTGGTAEEHDEIDRDCAEEAVEWE